MPQKLTIEWKITKPPGASSASAPITNGLKPGHFRYQKALTVLEMQDEEPADLSSEEGAAPLLLPPALSVCLSILQLPFFLHLFIHLFYFTLCGDSVDGRQGLTKARQASYN